MARLWKYVHGEPYMINPALGILAANPKRRKRKMARHRGKSYMNWVRSHRRKRNHYAIAGPFAAGLAANPHRRRRRRRHYKINPPRRRRGLAVRGFFGLPPVMPIVYASAGMVSTAAIEGFAETLLPTSMK